jgi:NAD+-processing family protein with receiver domain
VRILVLDDDPERHVTFARNLIGHEVTHVQSFDGVIAELLHSPRFDIVYLDRDLNDHGLRSIGPTDAMYGGIRKLTGEDVAHFIAKKLARDKYPKKIVVHSWNEHGGERIMNILARSGIPLEREPYHLWIGRNEATQM